MDYKPTKSKVSLTYYTVLNILGKIYNTKPTVAARPKGTVVRFSDTILIVTPIDSTHNILREGTQRMQTQYKNTRGQVCSIFSSLVWHATRNKKKRKKRKTPNLNEKLYYWHCRVSKKNRKQQ